MTRFGTLIAWRAHGPIIGRASRWTAMAGACGPCQLLGPNCHVEESPSTASIDHGSPSNPGTQRQVGVEVGLNFKQVLDDLNVRRNTWWGYGFHVFFDNFRIPFTAVGYRYDLNHGKWHGPNSGN